MSGPAAVAGPGNSDPGASFPALEMLGIRRVFGGTTALAGVDFEVRAGEIHGLLGENGAGKSTLVKILAGALSADGGTIRVRGEVLENPTPADARAAGISFIHQDLGLVQDLTVAENVAFAVGFGRRRGPLKLIDWSRVRDESRKALAQMGVPIDVDAPVRDFGIGTQSMIAIARALAADARLMILDEPTATLAAGEVEHLFEVLRRLRADGLGLVFVSHRMDEVESLCDRVTVLRDGSKVGTRTVADTSTDEIIQLIIGHDPRVTREEAAPATPAADTAGAAALTLDAFEGVAVGPLDLTVPRGSIFGLTGLAGAGQHEIAEILFGLSPLVGGRVELAGAPYVPRSPRAAIGRGLGFVPASRAEGVYPESSLRENVFDNPGRSRLWIDRGERGRTQTVLDTFDVRPRNPDALLGQLSGGNAQKVLLSRWFLRDLDLLILNEPTAGVDIGAREQIHAAMRRAAAERDVTLLIVSSDLEEIASVCDHAAVLYRGAVSAELSGSEVTVSNLSRSAVSYV